MERTVVGAVGGDGGLLPGGGVPVTGDGTFVNRAGPRLALLVTVFVGWLGSLVVASSTKLVLFLASVAIAGAASVSPIPRPTSRSRCCHDHTPCSST